MYKQIKLQVLEIKQWHSVEWVGIKEEASEIIFDRAEMFCILIWVVVTWVHKICTFYCMLIVSQ